MKDHWIPVQLRRPKDNSEHPTVARGPLDLDEPRRLICWLSSKHGWMIGTVSTEALGITVTHWMEWPAGPSRKRKG